jgi:hypothetical protein
MEHPEKLFDPKTLTNRATGAGSSAPTCSPLVGDEKIKWLRKIRIDGGTATPGAKKPAHYSDEWYTPPEIPAALGKFDLDPCAGPISAIAEKNVRPPQCGLSIQWKGRVWLNPPYSTIEEWMLRLREHGNGIALVNARPDTRWMQAALGAASGVLWMRGRVAFFRAGAKGTNQPIGSVLIAYGENNAEALERGTIPGVAMRVFSPGNVKDVAAAETDSQSNHTACSPSPRSAC